MRGKHEHRLLVRPTRLAQALRAKKLGAVELFDLYAARVRQHNRALNAVCVMDLDAGRKAARAAERLKRAGAIVLRVS